MYFPDPVFNIIKQYANFDPRRALIIELEKAYKSCKTIKNKPHRVKFEPLRFKMRGKGKYINAPFNWVKETNNRIVNNANIFDEYNKVISYYERENLYNFAINPVLNADNNLVEFLKNASRNDLRAFCRTNKIKGFSKFKRLELVSHIIKNF